MSSSVLGLNVKNWKISGVHNRLIHLHHKVMQMNRTIRLLYFLIKKNGFQNTKLIEHEEIVAFFDMMT